jgi:pimeloyl-ACP methyl ester carboxylesterase
MSETETGASFGHLYQVDAGVLDVGYVAAGPAGGPAVLLLHGWPYDIHSYAEVAPLLAAQGYRVIVPHLRGYGTTRFLSDQIRGDARQRTAIGACRRRPRVDGRARHRGGDRCRV